jgi:hypothetical protein
VNEKRATSTHQKFQNIPERGRSDIYHQRSREGSRKHMARALSINGNSLQNILSHVHLPGIIYYLLSVVRDDFALDILCNYSE